jgi:hypothetical protein
MGQQAAALLMVRGAVDLCGHRVLLLTSGCACLFAGAAAYSALPRVARPHNRSKLTVPRIEC